MINENNVEMIEKAAETGMEVVTKATKNNDLLKKVGVGVGYITAGALVYEGGKALIEFGKAWFKNSKKKKNDNKQSEASDEKTETIED